MAQFLRPDSDVTTDSWTSTPLYQKIDEATADDGDYIQSPNGADTTDYCEIGLSNATDPTSSTGHTVRYRYRANIAFGTRELTVYLRQGASTTIASWLHTGIAAFTWVQANQSLSGAEADSITDYNDLRLRFEPNCSTGTVNIQVSWAEFEIPDAAAAAGDWLAPNVARIKRSRASYIRM